MSKAVTSMSSSDQQNNYQNNKRPKTQHQHRSQTQHLAHSTLHHSSSSSLDTASTSSQAKRSTAHQNYSVSLPSQPPPLRDDDLNNDWFDVCNNGLEIENDDEIVDESADSKTTIFNSSWLFPREFLLGKTPSRRDGISYSEEIDYRRKGTTFIRDLSKLLKLKPICKETAYVYFHRFYVIRSFKQYEPTRIAMACMYFACKYEDHPIFKDHLVKVAYLLCNNNQKLNKEDKEYIEYCDQLILDENLLLQILGFQLQIRHFQVIIVESCQRPIQHTSQELYTSAYQIASEINRLTMLCVEYNAPVLACVSLYLAACYKCFNLPENWCTSIIPNANSQTLTLVKKIGDHYRDQLSTSQLIKKLLCESYIRSSESQRASVGSNSSKANSRTNNNGRSQQLKSHHQNSSGHHPQSADHLSSGAVHLSQHFMNTFSPDSAYSSSSSAHSPQEIANNQHLNNPNHGLQSSNSLLQNSSLSGACSTTNASIATTMMNHSKSAYSSAHPPMLTLSSAPTSNCYANSKQTDSSKHRQLMMMMNESNHHNQQQKLKSHVADNGSANTSNNSGNNNKRSFSNTLTNLFGSGMQPNPNLSANPKLVNELNETRLFQAKSSALLMNGEVGGTQRKKIKTNIVTSNDSKHRSQSSSLISNVGANRNSSLLLHRDSSGSVGGGGHDHRNSTGFMLPQLQHPLPAASNEIGNKFLFNQHSTNTTTTNNNNSNPNHIKMNNHHHHQQQQHHKQIMPHY